MTAAQRFSNKRLDMEPPASCYAFAHSFAPITDFGLDPASEGPGQVVANVKSHLLAGFPSMFGFPAFSDNVNAGEDGKVAFPSQSSRLDGGHANVAAG